MKNLLLAAALCAGVFSLPVTANAADLTDGLKKCGKKTSAKCLDKFPEIKKALEDITAGRKPKLALDGLPIAELGKFLSLK
jgi:hypothetical protein